MGIVPKKANYPHSWRKPNEDVFICKALEKYLKDLSDKFAKGISINTSNHYLSREWKISVIRVVRLKEEPQPVSAAELKRIAKWLRVRPTALLHNYDEITELFGEKAHREDEV
jgi:hypothetical protein